MAKKNIKKIFIGLVLIVFSLVSVLAAFYILEIKPELAVRAKTSALTTPKVKVEEKIQTQPQFKDTQEAGAEPIPSYKNSEKSLPLADTISLKSLVQQAEAVYGQNEQSKKEGLLWVDRKSSKIIITLGAINGLAPGNRLAVYEGKQKIGQVSVDASFDVISYVHPIKESMDFFKNDYYRVVLE